MSAEWIAVDAADAIAPGEYRVVEVNGTEVAVFNVDGSFYAVEDVCTHDYSGLTGGDVCGHQVICPRHGAAFDVRTGEALTPPAFEDIATFPTRVVDGVVQVRDAQMDGSLAASGS